jgi:hypothetical protein
MAVDSGHQKSGGTVRDTDGYPVIRLSGGSGGSGTNLIGAVQPRPAASTGYVLQAYKTTDLDESEEEVHGAAVGIYGWSFYNDAATEVYVKLYNANAATVIVGTTVPVITVGVPPNHHNTIMLPYAVRFGTAFSIAATTGGADTDVGAPAANQVVGTVFYLS